MAAGVEHGGVLGHHQLPLHALVAEIRQGHAHLAVVVGGMGAEHMAPGGGVLVPMAPHSRGRALIEQEAVIRGDHEVAYARGAQPLPGRPEALQHPIEDIKAHPFLAGVIDFAAVHHQQPGLLHLLLEGVGLEAGDLLEAELEADATGGAGLHGA